MSATLAPFLPRTRAQMYRGEADWTLIGKVKNNPQIRIPIIGNGDVDSGPKAREMFDRYGNISAMLAAYNAGPGRYDEHRATGRPLPAETRAYVAALAPVLGGTAPSDAPSRQPAPPPDWRDAPLFVQRPDGSQSTVTPSSGPQSGDLFAAASERDR